MLEPLLCSSDKFLRRKISINYLQMWGTYILDMWSLPSSIRNLTLFHSFFWQLGGWALRRTLHRVDRIKLPGIYMNPQSFPQQSMRNLAYVEFIKTRGLQSLSVILWVSAPPNQIPCELFPATDRILIQFKLKFSMWVCSPFHIKVIFEYKSYLYTHTTFLINLRLYLFATEK